MAYLRITSHRARHKFKSLGVRHLDIVNIKEGHFTIIADGNLSLIASIKGIKKCRKPKYECITPIYFGGNFYK